MNTIRSGLWVAFLSFIGYAVAQESERVDKNLDIESVILLPPSNHEPPPKPKE